MPYRAERAYLPYFRFCLVTKEGAREGAEPIVIGHLPNSHRHPCMSYQVSSAALPFSSPLSLSLISFWRLESGHWFGGRLLLFRRRTARRSRSLVLYQLTCHHHPCIRLLGTYPIPACVHLSHLCWVHAAVILPIIHLCWVHSIPSHLCWLSCSPCH